MRKGLIFLTLALLLVTTVQAVTLEKGTILDPSSENMSCILGMNHTGFSEIAVHSNGWRFEDYNYTFDIDTGSVNMSEFNHTSTGTFINLRSYNLPADTSVNRTDFTITSLADGMTVVYGTELIEFNTDGVFSVDITNVTNTLKIDSGNYLALSFENRTEGILADQDKSITFNNTNYVTLLSELSLGYVKAMFNAVPKNVTGQLVNWTQYYEFDNEQSQTHSEEMYLLDDADSLMYFRTLDYGNAPVKDVVLRAYHVYPSTVWNNYTLIGQRLTSNEGYNFFLFDSSSQVLLTAHKDGYELLSFIISPADEVRNSEDTAYVINLDYNSTSYSRGVGFYVPHDYGSNSSYIRASFFIPSYSKCEYNTSYRSTLTEQSKDGYDRCIVYLYNGTDFDTTLQNDLTLGLYLDSSHYRNYVIKFVDHTYRVVPRSEISGLDVKKLKPVMFIGIIILASLVTIILQNSVLGVQTFKILGMLLVFVSPSFWGLSLYILITYLIKPVRELVEGQ